MSPTQAERAAEALGFSLPPHRLPFEEMPLAGIGIIGLHWVVQIMHVPAYRAARFPIAASAEIVEDRIVETRSKGHDVGEIIGDWRELIARDDVEVLDCSFGHHPSREARRLEVVEAAAEAGKPLMIHKPVATSLALAERMAGVARQARSVLAVNQDCRYNPANFATKGLLTPERLGRPRIIEVRNYWKGPPRSFEDRRFAHLAHTIHHADLIRWWVGERCLSVYCKAGGVTDLTTYEFADGTLAHHVESHSGVGHHETYTRIMAERGVIVGGHNWNWHIPSTRGLDFVDVYPDPSEPAVSLPLPEHVYEPIWSDVNPFTPHSGPYYDLGAPIAGMMGTMGLLMRSARTHEAPETSIDGAIESMRMCLAAQISARENRPIDPADVPLDTSAE